MSSISPILSPVAGPSRDGFLVDYSPSAPDEVIIRGGSFEGNGKLYKLLADTIYKLTTMSTPFNLHYVYIDDDASSAPTAVFIDSTTPPVWDPVRRGMYNGDDVSIGFCYSPSGSAMISKYKLVSAGGKYARMFVSIGGSAEFNLALNMSPSGGWQTPNTRESSVILPPNAQEIYLWMNNSNIGGLVVLSAIMSEYATGGYTDGHLYGELGGQASEQRWIPLGASRNVRISGKSGDDNFLTAYFNGVGYLR